MEIDINSNSQHRVNGICKVGNKRTTVNFVDINLVMNEMFDDREEI